MLASFTPEGEVINKTSYTPYGKVLGEPVSNFGYAGEWTDDATGHVYLRARWLDVEMGVFLSEDPLVQMTMNAFGYTEGNLLTYIDPLGLFTWRDFGDWVYNNSTELSIGLTTAGVLASATGLAAPVGVVLAATGTAVSGYAAYESFERGDIDGGIINTISTVPGMGFLGATLKSYSVSVKTSRAISAGKIKTRYEARSISLPSRTLSNTMDNMTTYNTYYWGASEKLRDNVKGISECV